MFALVKLYNPNFGPNSMKILKSGKLAEFHDSILQNADLCRKYADDKHFEKKILELHLNLPNYQSF